MRTASYPDWLTPHLTDGVYANKTSTGYTIYRAHFVYDPVKKRSRKITDEVLGMVTKKDGFIPKKSYEKPLPVLEVLSFGEIKAVLDITIYAFNRTLYNMSYFKNEIIVGSVLLYLYQRVSPVDFSNSVLKLFYPHVRLHCLGGKKVYAEIKRGAEKIKSILNGCDISMFRYVYLVRFNETYTVIGLSDQILSEAKEKGVKLKYEKE